MTARASDSPARTGTPRLELDAWGSVFCGGASRRMGRDKALLELEGETLVARAARTLAEVVPTVLLASGGSARPELGLECVLDGAEDVGPLAGLAAVLARAESGGARYVCALACDVPRVTPAAFRALLARARRESAGACLAQSEGGVEPLVAVYDVAVLPAVRAALARGERRLDAFHPAVRLAFVELEPECLANLNTPEDLRSLGGVAP